MKTNNAWKKRFVAGAAFLACVGAALTLEASVSISSLTPAPGAAVTSGVPVTVTALLTTNGGSVVQSVVLSYAWNGGGWNTQAMTRVSGTNYVTTIPPAVSSLAFYVTCQYDAGVVISTTNAGSTTLPDYMRYADFDVTSVPAMDYAWVPQTPGISNWVYTIGATEWVAINCPSTLNGPYAPPGGTNRYFGLKSLVANSPIIRTPKLVEGVGTIYFTSMIRDTGYGAQLAVQYTTTNTLPTDWQTANIWQTATNIVYPINTGIREKYAAPIILNNREIRYVRFLRTDNGSTPGGALPSAASIGTINIDNIAISRPPTGVTLGENLYNPGYPAQDQDVKVRCQVTDVETNVPSINRRVKVWYSWQNESGPWTETNMVAIAERVYEGVIPKHGPGTMYYWFQCDFDGYFYSRDPDGPTGAQPTRNEKVGQSPVYLIEKGEDNYRNYEIRRYRSDVEVMRVVCSNVPSASIIDKEKISQVGDYVWQGLTLVSGHTNLLWTFAGTNGYVPDATAFDTNVWSWGDNDQDFPYPPVAGYAERNATNSIKAELVYDGTLLIRMNETNGEYIIKRAVYQNFDIWPASQTDFEESLGLFAIQTFKQDFNTNSWGYGYDAYTGNYTPVTVDTTPLSDFVRGGQPKGRTTDPVDSWWYDYARVVKERNVLTAARRAIELEGIAARGTVWKTPAERPSLGIEKIEFKARLSLNDRRYTWFQGTNGFNPFVEGPNWPKGYWAETQFRAASRSPGLASCSVLTWITPTGSDEPNYYETRLTQADPTAGGDNRLQLALYRWQDGVATPVGTPQTVTGGQTYDYDLTTPKALRVQMPASGNTITARVGRIDEVTLTNIWYFTVPFSVSPSSTDMGSVGFISYDALPEISSLKVFDGTNTLNLLPGDNWGAGLNSTNWNMGGRRSSADPYRWKINGNSLVRNMPSQTLAINICPMPDANSWYPDSYKNQNITNLVVTSLDYTSFSLPLTVWDAHFVEIQNVATGEINAVVDELSLTPWRAATRADNKPVAEQTAYNWTSPSQQETWMSLIANQACWLVMEGWINTSSGSKGGEVQFIRSRANTNLVQALVSPYLANNIGSIAFDWRASGVSNVVFAIDRTDLNGYPAWAPSPVLIVTNDALSGTVNLAIRTLFPGRIRIRLCEGSAPNAVFKIDNLVVRDYPPRDDTTWQAYNALITAAQPSRAFPPTNNNAQTAYLNNSPTNGVALSERLDQYQPFIQTPKVGTGIGEITFWYRNWDTNRAAVISLQAAPDETGPWEVLTNIVVASTQTNYLYFSNDRIYEPDLKVLRLYGSTNANRVCIDNVLMTEPVRAGYEFRLVRLLPAQPLVGEPPGLKVEIGRFIMNPTNIRIYASWFVGTNTWGYTNWWSTAYAKVELTNSPGAPRIFQTPDSVVLPAGAVDDVVQFFVWGVHGGIDIAQGDRPILQGTNAFVNPPWYYPADLNAVTPSIQAPELPALGSLGWSPYYYVYSCPPYSVWVNELRYDFDWSALNTEFIEIVGPAGAALGRWTLQMVNLENVAIEGKTSVITNGFVLKPATKGWGFLLWGDQAMSSYGDHILFPDWADGRQDMPLDGGVRLIRSNGAWEDRVAWGYWSQDTLVTNGYTYAGYMNSAYTLSLRSVSTNQGSKASDFFWDQVEDTPYAVNKFQRLYDTIGFYMIYSAIGPHGAHSLGTNPGTIEIAPGGSTNIVYTADTWYRIGTMQTNGVPVGAAPGLKAYTQTLVNVQSAITNQVTFTNANWDQTGLTNSVPIPWVTNYYPTSEAAAVANTNIARDYLLNISPTNNHAIAFAIESITVSNAVTVTVKLADGGDPLATTINGAVKLYGKPTLNASNWVVIADATVSNASFNVSGKYTLPAVSTSTNTFFKANIE
jgi:hypothetical protein